MKEIAYETFLDEEDLEKLRIRIHTNKGQVSDVVVQYESLINDKWTAIVRYDCAHGFFHRDELYPKGLKDKQVISITSLKDAMNYAEQDIKDRWRFYKERYLKKLKK
jgi:hypothetical protein